MLKKLIVGVLAGLMLTACGRDRGVYAGNEQLENHHPADIKGKLLRTNMVSKTIGVQIENGLEQTFKFDDTTELKGLVGKEGSEVTVHWRGDNDAKMATQVEVTQINIAKPIRHRPRRWINRG